MLCVLDFEATCDKNRAFTPPHEIIEFPSVLIGGGEFQEFCKPLYNIKLTDFCKQLTGITQVQVSNALDFPTVLQHHHQWLLQAVPELAEWEQSQIGLPPVMIVTCGNWDLCTMLIDECRRWLIVPPPIYQRVINIKDVFRDRHPGAWGGMPVMLDYLGLELQGRHHSGLDDSRNIARIAQRLTEEGAVWADHLQIIQPKEYKMTKQERAKRREHLQKRLADRK